MREHLNCIYNSKYEIQSGFRAILSENMEEAVSLLNRDKLCFHCLYALRHDIGAMELYRHLSYRNALALNFIDEVLNENSNITRVDCSPCKLVEATHAMMKWVMSGDYKGDIRDDDLDKLYDAAAAILIKEYMDKTILDEIADMIFYRNRTGRFYNDLVWIFFEAAAPEGIIILSKYLNSENEEDTKLALRLLDFIGAESSDRGKACCNARNWLKENYLHLHYTGESFQQSINPLQFRVIYEAKYLCKLVDIRSGKIIEELTKEELANLDSFLKLGNEERVKLAAYSSNLRSKALANWNKWISLPIDKQLEEMKEKEVI